MSLEEQKPAIGSPTKSSMEILSELFSTFDAEPPVIVKKEAGEEPAAKKHKKGKRKHKHKDKKHRKKTKKRTSSHSSDSSAVDVTDILIKKEKTSDINESDGTSLQDAIENIIVEPVVVETTDNKLEDAEKSDQNGLKKNKIIIKDLKFSSIFDATMLAIKEQEKLKQTEDGELSQSEVTGDEKSSEEFDARQKAKKEKHKKKHKHSKHDDEKLKKRKHTCRSRSRERNKRQRSRSQTPDIKKDDRPATKSHHKVDHDHCRERRVCKHKSGERENKDEYYANDKSRDFDGHRRSREKDETSRKRSKDTADHRSKERDEYDYEDKKQRKHKDNSFYRTDAYSSNDKDEKWFMKDRYRGYTERDRERERRFRENSEENANHIDKKKLLEIARKNAIQMMKSGSLPGALTLGPQAQEKVIAAIKSGGKTVEELTDFCKTLSKKEELGELSSVSEDNISDSDGEKPFHHPFQIKERPVSITMNIKNSVPLPIKNSQERASELRIQFPVSSGQQHRKTENEWVPVSPKKSEAAAAVKPAPVPPLVSNFVAAPLPIEAPPLPVTTTPMIPLPPAPVVALSTAPMPPVFPAPANTEQNIDIATIVSQRLSAMRTLQENPNDVQALNVMYKAQKEMNSWAESKQQVGQFTGSTGAQILSQAELSSGYQAWARKVQTRRSSPCSHRPFLRVEVESVAVHSAMRCPLVARAVFSWGLRKLEIEDQLQTAAPVSGGMGMHLLQKMGWKPGEGLGKEKTGTLEPLLLEVKLDKKGIVAKEEQKKKQLKILKPNSAKSLQGKHPVSLLGEYASKHKLGAPQYELCFECGPDHKKNFLFRVLLNGAEYKPQIASPNKKEAKANAALICLQQLGILLG